MAGCTRRTVTLYELHPPHASPCCRRHLHLVIPLVGGTRRTQCLTATATRHGRRRGSLYLQQLAPTAGSPCHMRIRGGLHRPYGGAAGRVQPAACPSMAGGAGSRRQLLRVQSAAAPRPLVGLHLQQVRGSARGGLNGQRLIHRHICEIICQCRLYIWPVPARATNTKLPAV